MTAVQTLHQARRIQRRRTKGWRMPKNTVYVGRPTVFGNPFTVADAIANDPELTVEQARARCVRYFRSWLTGEIAGTDPAMAERRQAVLDEAHSLAGLDLACWCPPGAACHADVLIELVAKADRERAAAREKARGLLL